MTYRNKKRDMWFKRITWLVVVIAITWVTVQLDEPKPTMSPAPFTRQAHSSDVASEGYEQFTVESLGFSFAVPAYQTPLKATTKASNARVNLVSRDFAINIHEGPGFVLQPWLGIGDTSLCRYDGALNSFQSEGKLACDFSELTIQETQIFATTFTDSETKRYLRVLPLLHRKFFMEVSADYVNDCTSNSVVCEKRAEQTQNELNQFIGELVEKNHNLFAQ